jgi:shikimate kinase
MKIFLTGFMGSGKTTIGRRLAQQTGFNFVDSDRFIEMQQGMTVAEIFAQRGEAAFREMERNLLLELQPNDSLVVSTGGGMPCHNDNMDLMLASGKVIYLKTSPQELARRLLPSRDERPLIREKNEAELLHYIIEQLTVREHFYNRADSVMQTEEYSMDELSGYLEAIRYISIIDT